METDKPRKAKYGSIVRAQYSLHTIKTGDFDLLTKVTFWFLLSLLKLFYHWQFVVKKEQIMHIIWILAFVFSSVYFF
jgi:hypothetical protein